MRETVFNWLDRLLPGARCLDLFAGTGALGFEALSRGAAHAVLVEQDRHTASALSRQKEELGADAEVVCDDARNYLDKADLTGFDIVFLDPPYELAAGSMLESLRTRLAPGTLIYLERDSSDEWPLLAGFEWTRRAQAGAVAYGIGEQAASGKISDVQGLE